MRREDAKYSGLELGGVSSSNWKCRPGAAPGRRDMARGQQRGKDGQTTEVS